MEISREKASFCFTIFITVIDERGYDVLLYKFSFSLKEN
jgi:hypothetical protein